MKNQIYESNSRAPFCWLDNAVGMAFLAMVWSLSNPFGDEQLMD